MSVLCRCKQRLQGVGNGSVAQPKKTNANPAAVCELHRSISTHRQTAAVWMLGLSWLGVLTARGKGRRAQHPVRWTKEVRAAQTNAETARQAAPNRSKTFFSSSARRQSRSARDTPCSPPLRHPLEGLGGLTGAAPPRARRTRPRCSAPPPPPPPPPSAAARTPAS